MLGLFSKKEKCSICSQETTSKQLSDGYVCGNCLGKCGNHVDAGKDLKIYSIAEVNTAIKKAEEDKVHIAEFKTTRKVAKFIEFDDEKKKFLIPKKLFTEPKIYDYFEITDFELYEDGDVITKGGLGNAIVGGLLLGGVGAIVGGVTGGKKSKSIVKNMSVKITVNRKANPVINIVLLNIDTKTDSFVYKGFRKQADEIIAILKSIMDENKNKQEVNAKVSPVDEILKYKTLLDQGIITEEEFDKKKKELLDL